MIIPRVQPFKTTAKGLIGCWPAFEGAGAALHDVSGYGQDLTAAGVPDWVDQELASGLGTRTAISLDGATQYLQAAAPGLYNFARTQPFSVVINTTFAAAGNEEQLIGCLDPSNNYVGWELLKASSDNGNWIQAYLINTFPSNCIQLNWNLTPAANTAYQFAVIYNGNAQTSGFSLYANGKAVSQQSVLENNLSASPVSTIPILIGRRNNGTDYHAGNIGETRIYNRVLAASEIWDIYVGDG